MSFEHEECAQALWGVYSFWIPAGKPELSAEVALTVVPNPQWPYESKSSSP